MRALVQPKYYQDDPTKHIMGLQIELMLDPQLDKEEGIRTFLDLLKETERLEITTSTLSPFGTSISYIILGNALATDL